MSHTVYHTLDNRVLGITATPDPEFELAHRLAGTTVKSFSTNEFDDADPARTSENVRRAVESGRVQDGRVVTHVMVPGGPAGGVDLESAVVRALEKLIAQGKIAVVAQAPADKPAAAPAATGVS